MSFSTKVPLYIIADRTVWNDIESSYIAIKCRDKQFITQVRYKNSIDLWADD